MVKLLIACNTLTNLAQPAYSDHKAFIYHLAKTFPQIEVFQMDAKRVSIDRFRNSAFQMAIKMEMDYLMFIDDDMQFQKDIFDRLFIDMGELDIIAALNYIRAYPFDPMAFRYNETGTHLEHLSDEEIDTFQGSVIECDAIGTAVCLLKMEKLKKIPAPWFITGPHNTEDIYFCIKAKEYVKASIGVHLGAATGHILDPEVISYHTRTHLKKYFESYGYKEEKNQGDRGDDYIAANILPILSNVENS